MATSEWKQPISKEAAEESTITHVSLSRAKKFFAMDASGSTSGRIIRAELAFVKGLHTNSEDTVAKWDHDCETPQLVDKIGPGYLDDKCGGTSPDQILRNPSAVKEIESSDVWFLLTDGEINQYSVAELTNLADELNLIHIPVVLLIVGRKASSGPALTNISVGVPFFANSQESVILYKDATAEEIFVVAAKGTFASLLHAADESSLADLNDWKSLPMYRNEAEFAQRCEELGIEFVPQKDRQITKAVSLGPNWDTTTDSLVDITKLLAQAVIEQSDLANLLEDEAFNRLSVICKTRNCLQSLRHLLQRQKQPEIIVRFEDSHGASNILDAIQTGKLSVQECNQMREQLREAHAANRAAYLQSLNFPSKEVQKAKDLNRLIDRALASLADIESSAYTAEILGRKSNRARRAEVANASDAEVHVSHVDLSDSVDAFRETCSICCGENQIMSIALKKLDSVDDNTSDFALNFPLAAGHGPQNTEMISSQCICFQCALLCRKSIFNENLSAILPTACYTDANKPYINHQLILAITGGLSTGISGMSQVLMTILDRTIETKAWCSDQSHLGHNEQDLEASMRRRSLQWMLANLLRNVVTREDFAPTGRWVKYPEALRWVAEDFNQRQLDSWIVQYPVTGFCQMLRWYELLQLEISPDLPDAMRMVKLAHLVVSNIMADLLRHNHDDRSWTYRFLELMYEAFNAPGVPKDQGYASILEPTNFWSKLEAELGGWSDTKRFLSDFAPSLRQTVTHRIQLVIFWALYHQKEHASPKTFFQNIQLKEPLAQAALNPAAVLQESTAREILCSIFCPPRPSSATIHFDSSGPPFASPFGPSVLQCGYPACGVKFYTDSDAASLSADTIRQRRAEHFKTSFGTAPRFNTSQTGLPEPTSAPVPPSSDHYNLHASIVRVWSNLPRRSAQSLHENPATLDPAQVALPSKEDVISGFKPAVTTFIDAIHTEICVENRRGNIYDREIETAIQSVLPSFFEALRVASGKLGLNDCSGASYVYDWSKKTVAAKMEYELSLREVEKV